MPFILPVAFCVVPADFAVKPYGLEYHCHSIEKA